MARSVWSETSRLPSLAWIACSAKGGWAGQPGERVQEVGAFDGGHHDGVLQARLLAYELLHDARHLLGAGRQQHWQGCHLVCQGSCNVQLRVRVLQQLCHLHSGHCCSMQQYTKHAGLVQKSNRASQLEKPSTLSAKGVRPLVASVSSCRLRTLDDGWRQVQRQVLGLGGAEGQPQLVAAVNHYLSRRSQSR